jgi:segregation and condensation protein B
MDETTIVTEDLPGIDAASLGANPRETQEVQSLARSIEAILLTLDRPTPARRLAEGLGLAKAIDAQEDAEGNPVVETPKRSRRTRVSLPAEPSPVELIQQAVALLNDQYESTQRTFRIESVAGGYRLMTLPAFAPVLARFHQTRSTQRLSKAAIETLAVIAYKQPITRAHLEAIRGVACGEVLRSLLDRRLITIAGRAEELGRPMLYGTSKEFLDAFGLSSVKDLPTIGELQGML